MSPIARLMNDDYEIPDKKIAELSITQFKKKAILQRLWKTLHKQINTSM